jgi:hypothetical protein
MMNAKIRLPSPIAKKQVHNPQMITNGKIPVPSKKSSTMLPGRNYSQLRDKVSKAH